MSAHHHPLHRHGVSGLRLRLRAGWAREDLDRRLAEGSHPAADPLIHAHAERLVTPASRAKLAAGLERAVATADTVAAPLSSAVPVRRRPVRGARHELMRLAGELRHMPEPRPRGVAMAERLLIDPSSPLYTASSSDEVTRAARDAAACMRGDEHPGEPREHHFCIPTVAPLPPQPLVESTDW